MVAAGSPDGREPKNRDERAVLATLRQLDPCALLSLPVVKPLSPTNGTIVDSGPHRCQTFGNEFAEVTATVGVRFDRSERFYQRRLALEGVTAYLADGETNCTVSIPVSFTRAIEVDVDGYTSEARDERCRIAKRIARTAAATLADPTSTPFRQARWDACTALRSAIDDQGKRMLRPDVDGSGIDSCVLASPLAIRSGTSWVDGVTLWLDFDDDPLYGWRSHTSRIAHRTVGVSTGRPCTYVWAQGPSGLGWPDRKQAVQLSAPNCRVASRIAPSVMDVLEGPMPPGGRHIRLTYRPSEPDVAAPGACLDLSPGWQCEPYHEVSLPNGGNAIARAANLDPNVNCAIALDAVHEHFGPHLAPVTTTGGPYAVRGCVFVQPSHATEVWISVSAEPTALTSGLVDLSVEEADVGGLPANSFAPGSLAQVSLFGGGRGLSVRLGDDLDSSRVFGWVLSRNRLDSSQVQAFRATMADIISVHFR